MDAAAVASCCPNHYTQATSEGLDLALAGKAAAAWVFISWLHAPAYDWLAAFLG
jgi:hypothetical protein